MKTAQGFPLELMSVEHSLSIQLISTQRGDFPVCCSCRKTVGLSGCEFDDGNCAKLHSFALSLPVTRNRVPLRVGSERGMSL